MKSVAVILAPGFEEIEAVTIIDLLRRAEIKVTTASISEINVTGSHAITIKADDLLENIKSENFDMVILPGGLPGTTHLKNSKNVHDLLKKQHKEGKLIGAICAAPTVLEKAVLLESKKVTSHPSEENVFCHSDYKVDRVVKDENILTSRAVGTAIEFSLEIITLLCEKNTAEDIASKILFNK